MSVNSSPSHPNGSSDSKECIRLRILMRDDSIQGSTLNDKYSQQHEIIFSKNLRQGILRPLILQVNSRILVEFPRSIVPSSDAKSNSNSMKNDSSSHHSTKTHDIEQDAKQDSKLDTKTDAKPEEVPSTSCAPVSSKTKSTSKSTKTASNTILDEDKIEVTSDTHSNSTSDAETITKIIEFYSGPLQHIDQTNVLEFFSIQLLPNASNKLIMRLNRELPPDLVCSYIRFVGYGVIGVSSSGKLQQTGKKAITLSFEDKTILNEDDFHIQFLGRKRKNPQSERSRKKRVTEYGGVAVSEWVEIEDRDISFVDNQLHEPGDGVCLFNWVSFRYAAAKRLQEKIERERKFGVLKGRRKRGRT